MTDDLRALSVMQPWTWLLAAGLKDIENRDWPTHFRGRVLLHAGKRIDREAMTDLLNGRHPVTGERHSFDLPDTFETGGIVGEATIVGCAAWSSSPWFVGKFGFVIKDAKPLPFIPCKGALGFFRPTTSQPTTTEEG